MIREIPVEVKRWKAIKENNIEHPLGYICEDNSVWLITEGFRNYVSLREFIRKRHTQLSKRDRIRILITISNTMTNLLKLDETNSHGHLSSNNILVSIGLLLSRELSSSGLWLSSDYFVLCNFF